MILKFNQTFRRWIAVFLVAFAAVGTVANACAMSCAGHQMTSAAMDAAPDDAPPCDQCPQSQLCDFAFSAAIVSNHFKPEVLPVAAQPAPLILDTYRFDPRPPLKPPVA